MEFRDRVIKNRSYRRFFQDRPVEPGLLRDLIDLARLTPSSKNLQPLKYIISCNEQMNSRIFPALGWARYLGGAGTPAEGEKPAAYIVVLVDHSILKTNGYDEGIAAQTVLLGAVQYGIGGCIIHTVDRKQLSEELKLESHLEISLVLALGFPKEEVILEPVIDGDIKYHRRGYIHYVPKRSLDEILIGEY
ncbi:MAG: nitroreductase family protein [Ignavibacteriales bacterium]|nr:nitroreductase family protein [Ignavibacteriales bacterium]MCF8305939.1 nitroreductase family protein [Ignavibacteriales bacterium]MCF8315661.1 nitroreductase family protein [Ignavibacteriales bacterium]MCF8437145.1 nitroreductase family protein [Ignavibacteriales bacterium]